MEVDDGRGGAPVTVELYGPERITNPLPSAAGPHARLTNAWKAGETAYGYCQIVFNALKSTDCCTTTVSDRIQFGHFYASESVRHSLRLPFAPAFNHGSPDEVSRSLRTRSAASTAA